MTQPRAHRDPQELRLHVRSRRRVRQRRATLATRPPMDLPQRRRPTADGATPAPSASTTSAASPSASHSGARRPRSRCAWSTATPTPSSTPPGGATASAPPSRAAQPLASVATAYRSIHGEGDACPSLICDRYDRWLVVQLMSAGLEAFRDRDRRRTRRDRSARRAFSRATTSPLRAKEELPVGVELLRGDVPDEIEVSEHGVRYLAAPWRGQKTGAFLDQRENRALVGERRTRTRARLLQLPRLVRAAPRAPRGLASIALDVSADALARADENCARNGITNVELVEADAFDYLRSAERQASGSTRSCSIRRRSRRRKPSLPAAIRGYKEINLRAMRLLAPRRPALHRELQLSSHEAALPRDARRMPRRTAGDASRCATITRPAARSPRSADGSGDGIHQGRAARSARLTLGARHCWQPGSNTSTARPARSARSSCRIARHGLPSRS